MSSSTETSMDGGNCRLQQFESAQWKNSLRSSLRRTLHGAE
jgi:hypothetical protein